MSLAPSKRLSPEAIRDSASHRHQIPTGTGGRRRTARVPYKLTRVALRHRVWLLAAGHMMVFTIAYWLAFALRFDFQIPEEFWGRLIHTLPAVLAIKLAVFYLMGHYHGWWRYVTFSDLASLLRASLLSLVFLVVINHYLLGGHIPRAVVIVDCLVTALLIGSLRASWRLCREYRWLGRRHLRTAMMVGADHLERTGRASDPFPSGTSVSRGWLPGRRCTAQGYTPRGDPGAGTAGRIKAHRDLLSRDGPIDYGQSFAGQPTAEADGRL